MPKSDDTAPPRILLMRTGAVAIVMMVAAVVATRFMANQGRATLQHAAAAALRVVAEPETTGTLAALGDLRLDPCAVRAAP